VTAQLRSDIPSKRKAAPPLNSSGQPQDRAMLGRMNFVVGIVDLLVYWRLAVGSFPCVVNQYWKEIRKAAAPSGSRSTSLRDHLLRSISMVTNLT
jgi:hypothetical protein